jgi:non-specific serine/threonine protein kinase
LNATEKSLLSRLAVLYGDWVLEAAERICSGEGVEEGGVRPFTSLVDKSLVGTEQRKGDRYRQLETVRQYGQERLRECGEEAHWQGRHLAYFLSWRRRLR